MLALAIAAGAVLTGVLRVQTWAKDADPARKPIEVDIKTVTEDLLHGRLLALSLSDGATIRLDDGEERRIPAPDLVRITTTASRPPYVRRQQMLTLVGGDVLYGKIVDGREESVVVETADLGAITVTLESIRRIDFRRAWQEAYRDSVAWLNRTGDAAEDRVLLTNGDCLRGFVTSIDEDSLSIDGSLGEVKVPQRLVVAVRLSSPAPPRLNRPHLIVVFRNSGRLTATDLDWSGNVVEARLHDGQRVRVEAERVVGVDMIGGRWEWLSSHQPISYQHTPMLSLGWDYKNDHNVLGEPITVAGETFERGIGVHSRTHLTYDLKGAYAGFVTHFGIDDDSGPYADVSVLILVDGKPQFEKTDVVRGTLHGPVRLDVARANRIELIVDFGQNGDIQDRFNWVEAALIR